MPCQVARESITRNSVTCKKHQMRLNYYAWTKHTWVPTKAEKKEKDADVVTLYQVQDQVKTIRYYFISSVTHNPLYLFIVVYNIPTLVLSTSNCSEEFMLETPVQDMNSQNDEFYYGYIHCTTGLNCNVMIFPDESPQLLQP